jgi:transcriptional regulator with XRE-family HTH domain
MSVTQKIVRLMRLYRRRAVAEIAGLSPSTIDHLMAGQIPKIGTAKKLAAALGVDEIWLLDDRRGWPPKRTAPLGDLEQDGPQPPLAA